MYRTSKGKAIVTSVAIACTVSWLAVGQKLEAKRLDGAHDSGGLPRPGPSLRERATAVGVTSERPEIPFISPHAAAVDVPSFDSAWGGPRTGSEPTLSDRVADYLIDATLDPKTHIIEGKEQLTWRNRSDREVSSVFLHLYLNAFEGPGSTFFTEAHRHQALRDESSLADGEWGHVELERVEQDGARAPWSFAHPDEGPETDHTVVRVDLPVPVPPGGRTRLDISFRDQLPRVIARTGYFRNFHMVAQRFPKIGVLELPGERGAATPRWNVHEFHMTSEFYADWGSYDVRITVPKTFQVASTGEEQGPPIENGDLVTRRFAQGDVHDFAWMAASDFAPPLEGIYEGPGSPKVKVKVFYPPEFVASAAPALAATIDSLRWFSQALGPYPYRTSTCIIPPFNAGGAGGMEYQTLFTSDGTSVVDPGTLAASLLDLTTIHELGHGYFYGILATNEFEEPFLDEGLDDYWDIRMLDARMQVVHMGTPFWKRLGIDPTAGGFVLEREEGALDPHPADALGQNSWDRHSTQSYREVYHRTSTVLHDLEARLGRDVTDRAFRMFYEKWRFRHPSTADLREALVAASTDRRAVEQVFHQSIYGSEPIDDRVESIISTEELPRAGTSFVDGKWVEKTEQAVKKEIDEARERWKISHSGAAHGEGPYSYRTTVTVRRDGASVPQTLVVTFEDGAIETVRWDDERRWNTFVFVKPVKAKSAELDPAREILLDHDKLNDGRSVEPSPAASRRWAGEAWSFFDLLCSLLGTI